MNLAAFSVLAVAVVQDVEERTLARGRDQQEVRATYVNLVRDLFVAFFAEFDFTRLKIGRLLDAEYWNHARDAYITDFVYRIGEGYVSGDIALNPLGEYDAQAARLRKRGLDLMARAYQHEEIQPDGELVAFPLYGGQGRNRHKWGAAYVRVAVPSLPVPPQGMGLTFLAVALGGATLVAMLLVFLLMHLLVLEPLGRISEGAVRVSRGTYARPVKATGRGDEIDALIHSFNAMMAEIGQKREALEHQVEEVVARMRLTEQRLVLTDRLAAMGTLAAGIAHEINNPLGGMINALSSLRRRGALEAGADRYVSLVEDGLARIRDVVQRVLRFSPRSLSRGEVRLREVIEDAAHLTGYRLEKAGTSLAIRVDPSIRVVGDAAALGQVFLNLLINASHAVEGPERRIEVEASLDDEEVQVVVRDNGRGMTAEERRRAFDLFYTTREAGAGTGLGLSIAHQIVVDHGGQASIESEPGGGTEVWIRLPLA